MIKDDLPAPADPARPSGQLEYEPARRSQSRAWARRVMLIVAVCAAVIVAVRLGPHALRMYELNRLQNRCLDYRPDSQPALTIDRSTGKISGHVPPAWSQFYAMMSPPGLKSNGTLFLGRMHTPEGLERLVAVDLNATMHSVTLAVRMFEPGSLMRAPREMQLTVFDQTDIKVSGVSTFGQGVRDPSDSSHFTAGAIEGWITGDRTFVIEVRDD